MQALVNEPATAYGQITTLQNLGEIFSSEAGSSSILLDAQRGFSDKVTEMLQKINRITNLAPNWDSYHAEVPSPNALMNARSFLIDNHLLALPFYFIAPGVNGEVMIEFKKKDKAAELYFLPNDQNELILFEKNKVVFEGSLDDDYRRLLDFFNK